MIEPFLKTQLEPVARRRRRWIVSRDLALCWASAALVGLAFLSIYRLTGWIATWVLPVMVLGTLAASVIVWQRSRRWQPDFRQIGRDIETRHPELHSLLLTAIEQRPDEATGQLNYLQERVVQEAVRKSVEGRWIDTISEQRLIGVQLAQWAALLVLVASLSGLRVQTREAIALSQPTRITVNPGDTTIESGNGLAVLARFEGPLPAEVTLIIRPDGQPERRISMAKSLNDPVFGGTIPVVTNGLSYTVEFAKNRSADFKVKVFEYPRLERADAQLSFPAYTSLPEKRIENTRRISAVEGSTLNLALQLNKPVKEARLVARDKVVLPLAAQTNRASAVLEKFPLRNSQRYDLVLVDLEGRTNKVPAQIIVDVLTNRAPELHFTAPQGDQRVSALQEIKFEGEAWDDFGLKGYGITYSLGGNKPQSISLGGEAPAREKRQFSHLLRLEDLGAQPDQLLSYFVWADDVGPDGQIRRTASDMYYAEVRPFEEIFRQGQSQSQSEQSEESEGGNEATKLAELQKQILNATWRLQRENRVGLTAESGETKPKASLGPTYAKDAQVVEQSQRDALKQATAKLEQSENPQSKAMWETVRKEMGKAADHLGRAVKSPEPLPTAVEAEQAAYQALLKLSAHEYQIAQSRRSQSRSSSSQAMQRELDQLDMKESENRYETQKQAPAKANPEQREQQQVLNRLKELAQRQQDMNSRLKELQTALQEAKTEQEREEARRRLKRLREEEQQALADVDELLQRMDRPENQSRMADARQQLEQTRNQVQRASDMMDKESVGQALSSATRAERELQDLRDDFRKKNSAQFSEDMRQMRTEARDLAQKEDQIGERLQALGDPKHKTLSDSGETKRLSEQMVQQTQTMTNLLDQMTRVSQEAESSEPLLSKQLYDTIRKNSQSNIDESLRKSSELLKLSFFPEAGQFEQRARKGVTDLKEGVERAAESVLGDETEALRLARNELDDIARQLDKEVAQSETGANQPSPEGEKARGTGAEQNHRGQTNSAGSFRSTSQASGNSGQPGQQNNRSQGRGQAQDADQGQQLAQQGQGQSRNQSTGRQGQQGQAQGQQGQAQGQQGQAQGQQGQAQGQQGQAQGQQGQAQGQQGQAQGQQGQAQGQQGQAQGQQGQAQGQQGQAQGQQGQAQGQQGQAQGQQGQAQGQQGQAQGQQGQAQGQQGQGRQQANAPATPGRSRPRPSLTGQNPAGREPNNQEQVAQGQGGGGPGGPITGENFTEWSDRLRDVEEMLDYPDLRNEVAGVRDRARALRIDFKRDRKPPQASTLRSQLGQPLTEVRNRINEELARRESKDSIVPIDRDPVPQKFSELVRRYYENLGNGQQRPAEPRQPQTP